MAQDVAYTQEEFSHFSNILQNGTARIPVCFCLDVSRSMNWLTNPSNELIVTGQTAADDATGHKVLNTVRVRDGFKKRTKLMDLQEILKKLVDGLHDDASLRSAAIVSIVTFSKYADTIINFCEPVSLDGKTITDQISIGVDKTNMAEGLNFALQKLESMSKVLTDAQIESFKPVVILISDGAPTDGENADAAVRRLNHMESEGEVTVIPIGIYMDYEGKRWLGNVRNDHRIFTMESQRDYDNVFGMIQELIALKAPIISVDEEIMSENKFAQENDIPTTGYGETVSPDDLLNFFEFPEGI